MESFARAENPDALHGPQRKFIIDVAFGPDAMLYVVEYDGNDWFHALELGNPAGGSIHRCDVHTADCGVGSVGAFWRTPWRDRSGASPKTEVRLAHVEARFRHPPGSFLPSTSWSTRVAGGPYRHALSRLTAPRQLRPVQCRPGAGTGHGALALWSNAPEDRRRERMAERDARQDRNGHGSLVRWLRDQRLLRGPFLFVDYWANVLHLGGIIPERHVREGYIDPPLFRLGLDRPDLELPRQRVYLLLLLLGPLLLPLRSLRRLEQYRLRFRREVGEELLTALERYRLRLDPAAPGCVHISIDGTTLARDVLDPYAVGGFCSLFWAAYKLPVASLTAILLVAILTPVLYAAGLLGMVADYWVPVGLPVLVLLLYAVYREWLTALLGALPLLFGRYLIGVFHPAATLSWLPFFGALAGLFLLYVVIDWLFMPRPVPPVLMFYTSEGPGRPYARPGDAPYWLEGRCYWVWRYLILSPAELNKIWERDWERVDLWIRADGPERGMLEWVVTDVHYREIWVPYAKLGAAETLGRQRQRMKESVARGEAGVWLLEVDADPIVHYPFFRRVTFLEAGRVPARSVWHAIAALAHRAREPDVETHMQALDRARLRLGKEILGDVPEVVVRRASRHLVAQPWSYWRYPLGAATREEQRLYGEESPVPPPPAADPALQIKAPREPTPAAAPVETSG